jgi:hypothetical protein
VQLATRQVGLHQQRITAYRGLLAAPAGNIKGATAADRQGQAAEPGVELDGYTVAGSRLAFMRGQPTRLE